MAAEARSREREMKVKINFYNCEERYAVEEGLHKALKGTCREKGGLPRETGRGRRKEGNPHILNTVFFSSTPHHRAGDRQLPSGPGGEVGRWLTRGPHRPPAGTKHPTPRPPR